tara:strand:+ start:2851 stop:3474 length:624 start_codon:yes stop_codon:yes gene_type:complete
MIMNPIIFGGNIVIDWLYNKKYTDKFRGDPLQPGVPGGHTFTEVYQKYLPNSKKILEIGTQQGGFIKFCKDQMEGIFFVGADMYPYPKAGENCWVDDESFNDLADDYFIGDAFTEDFLKWVEERGYKNSFDLVIDDGPHTLESQKWMIENISSLLSDDGVFICEDVDNIGFANEIKAVSPFPTLTEIWDNSEKSGRWDDICVIISKR